MTGHAGKAAVHAAVLRSLRVNLRSVVDIMAAADVDTEEELLDMAEPGTPAPISKPHDGMTAKARSQDFPITSHGRRS